MYQFSILLNFRILFCMILLVISSCTSRSKEVWQVTNVSPLNNLTKNIKSGYVITFKTKSNVIKETYDGKYNIAFYESVSCVTGESNKIDEILFHPSVYVAGGDLNYDFTEQLRNEYVTEFSMKHGKGRKQQNYFSVQEINSFLNRNHLSSEKFNSFNSVYNESNTEEFYYHMLVINKGFEKLKNRDSCIIVKLTSMGSVMSYPVIKL